MKMNCFLMMEMDCKCVNVDWGLYVGVYAHYKVCWILVMARNNPACFKAENMQLLCFVTSMCSWQSYEFIHA